MLLVPRAGALVQRREQIGLLGPQLCSEHLGKQVVIAIPLARVIEWHNKEVAALQRLELRLAALLATHGIAKWPTQSVKYGGLE